MGVTSADTGWGRTAVSKNQSPDHRNPLGPAQMRSFIHSASTNDNEAVTATVVAQEPPDLSQVGGASLVLTLEVDAQGATW